MLYRQMTLDEAVNTTPNSRCGCILHPGQSHAQHMDDIARDESQKFLAQAKDETRSYWDRRLALMAHTNNEIQRLREKELAMRNGEWEDG